MHKNATKCNETLNKWCKNKHGASKIMDTLEMYQAPTGKMCPSSGMRCRTRGRAAVPSAAGHAAAIELPPRRQVHVRPLDGLTPHVQLAGQAHRHVDAVARWTCWPGCAPARTNKWVKMLPTGRRKRTAEAGPTHSQPICGREMRSGGQRPWWLAVRACPRLARKSVNQKRPRWHYTKSSR
jgi:hypothetical protein